MVKAQGGDIRFIEDVTLFKQAKYIKEVYANKKVCISEIDAQVVGETVAHLGGGRLVKGDLIDHSIGVVLYKKVSDKVEIGQSIFRICANQLSLMNDAYSTLEKAILWSNHPTNALPLFYGIVDESTGISQYSTPSVSGVHP